VNEAGYDRRMALSTRARVVTGSLVALAVMAAVLVWQLFAPGDPPPVQLAGCDIATLNYTFKRDGGVSYRDYDLYCIVRAATPPPACDEVMARYLASKGPLPTDLNVHVRGEDFTSPDVCRRHYRGDGTPE
jgi:hypothetical protein